MKHYQLMFLLTLVSFTGCQSVQHYVTSFHADDKTTKVVDKIEQPTVDHVNFQQSKDAKKKSVIERLPKVPAKKVKLVNYNEFDNELNQSIDKTRQPGKLVLANESMPVSAVLTLKTLEEMALENNPAIARAAAKVDAADGNWVQVGLPPNLVAGYSSDDIGEAGAAGKQGGFISQEFIFGGKLHLNRAIASQEVFKAEQLWAAEELRVRSAVRASFYEVLIAQERKKLLTEMAGKTNEAVKVSKDLLEAEEISKITLLQAKVEADRMDIMLQNAEKKQAAAWRKLATIIGDENRKPQHLAGSLKIDDSIISWEDALKEILRDSPEIAVAVAELQRLQCKVNREMAEVVPNVNVQVSSHHDNASGENLTGVEVSLPLPIWNRNQGGISQAQSNMVAAQRAIEQVELDLKKRLSTVYQAYHSAHQEVQKYKSEIAPNAKKSSDLVEQGFKEGEVNYLTLLTAQRTNFEIQLAQLEAQRVYWQRRIEIEGLLLEK